MAIENGSAFLLKFGNGAARIVHAIDKLLHEPLKVRARQGRYQEMGDVGGEP